jgi:class 3 adenylate cyclase
MKRRPCRSEVGRGERSDLTGYTALSERLDPEETREIMAQVFGRAADIIGRYDGRIEKFVGDAIMAIFGVPVAHEDDPVRAGRSRVTSSRKWERRASRASLGMLRFDKPVETAASALRGG